MRLGVLTLISIAVIWAAATSTPEPEPRLVRIVVDPGHGGADLGARGGGGLYEKDVVLSVSRRLVSELRERGHDVVFTREDDSFLTLAERADIANRVHGGLYLSIHANSARDRDARGPETYFLSLEASSEEAMLVAITENRVFGQEAAVDDSDDIVGSILGDLILTEHLRASSEIARAIQRNLADLPGPDRGVKQAPFAVLMGVNMPAALVEIGFLTNPAEAKRLRSADYQARVAFAVADAVDSYCDGAKGNTNKEATE